jgi:hypothetical protein
MTGKIIYIVVLFIGFIILTSKSCEPDMNIDQEARLKAEQDTILKEIRNDFEAEYLFEDKLMAYGEKAKQKILDFADYLSLYSRKDVDTLFKQQIKEMIYRLFYNENTIVQLYINPTNSNGVDEHNLNILLGNIDSSKYQSIEFLISDLRIIEPLHLDSIERYTGKLGCKFRITGITKTDTILLYNKSNRVKIITTRTKKEFGDETSLLIWQVFLFEIDAVN